MIEIIAVFLLTFIVRLWSTLVGGGAVVLIPALLFLGLNPQQAIATNRLASISQAFSLFQFHRQKQVRWKLGFALAGFAALGGGIGSFLMVSLQPEILEKAIGVFILLSLPMLLIKRELGTREGPRIISRGKQIGGAALIFLLGMLGGFFSATGVWFSYLYLWYYRLTFLQTAAIRKITGGAITLVSLSIFIPYGIVHWEYGLAMFAAGAIGSSVSAHYAQYLGNTWIKYLFIAVAAAAGIRLLFF